ncbi:hypothetical protein GYH30_029051 [Glycine max]|uniref:Transmembrane protein n=1 Tax=Glycine max TaxID=3847 RepID=A0A0R0I8W5_SOYBN|nr:hypothetical protein GYH30_029051 [Glycine max]
MVVVVVEGNPICCSNRKVQIFICIVPSFVFIGFCFCANNGRGSTEGKGHVHMVHFGF